MGRDIQKRKRRSSRPIVRQPNRPKKPLNPLANNTIAQNWNKNKTLSQNYRRLGLTAKLSKAPGGVAQIHNHHHAAATPPDPLVVIPTLRDRRVAVHGVRVERDAEGKIVRLLHKANPLHDLLNELEDESDSQKHKTAQDTAHPKKSSGVSGGEEKRFVDILEEQASVSVEKKHKRHQSEREREWCERLVAKHGDNTAKMARDERLNPMQQTEGDIRSRLAAYYGKKGGAVRATSA